MTFTSCISWPMSVRQLPAKMADTLLVNQRWSPLVICSPIGILSFSEISRFTNVHYDWIKIHAREPTFMCDLSALNKKCQKIIKNLKHSCVT